MYPGYSLVDSVESIASSGIFSNTLTEITESLSTNENITISPSSVSKILESEYILSPKVTRAKRKRIKKQLLELKNAAKNQEEADIIQKNIVAVEYAHCRHPRSKYFGELIQMDATPYE